MINPSFTKPFTKLGKGGLAGWPDPAISKTLVSMNMKFCRVLETSLNVLEMLKLLA